MLVDWIVYVTSRQMNIKNAWPVWASVCLEYQSGPIRIALELPRESRQRSSKDWRTLDGELESEVRSDQTESEHTPDAGQQIWKHSGYLRDQSKSV